MILNVSDELVFVLIALYVHRLLRDLLLRRLGAIVIIILRKSGVTRDLKSDMGIP